MEKAVIVATLMLALFSSSVWAQELPSGQIDEGRYVLAPENMDPPGQKVDRVGIQIGGEAARALYEALPAKEEDGACYGSSMKRAGKFFCVRSMPDSPAPRTEYSCMFGFMLANGEPAHTWDC